MMGLWNSDNPSLGQKARQLRSRFNKKKADKMREWLEELVKLVERELLLEASMGKEGLRFSINKFVYELEPLSETIDGVSRCYEISQNDKTVLLSELKRVYSDKSKYEDLRVEIDSWGTSLILKW